MPTLSKVTTFFVITRCGRNGDSFNSVEPFGTPLQSLQILVIPGNKRLLGQLNPAPVDEYYLRTPDILRPLEMFRWLRSFDVVHAGAVDIPNTVIVTLSADFQLPLSLPMLPDPWAPHLLPQLRTLLMGHTTVEPLFAHFKCLLDYVRRLSVVAHGEGKWTAQRQQNS